MAILRSTPAILLTILAASASPADTQLASSRPLPKVPDGFSIEVAAGPPLIERPIVASFDDDGRLYVAESSGSNDPVARQLELLPHRIVRLKDSNGDGKFDQRTIFSDHMMFPEGALFFDGSLYVAAPPSIWKLTDTDGDGIADQRIEWFQGKTLTGCANDLHGPYLGPDGWLYWCKGAFAEQTHNVNGHPWATRAAHIFRCRPDGTGLEPLVTGGMDNPVDVVFTPDGEAILTATYLVGDGRRDGLVHAIYGGVYGKEHGVLAGHPRTGELMPALVLMSPAAPCGLERYNSPTFGADYRDNLFVTQFNLRKVSRHVLHTAGSSFASEDSDFVTSDDVDFHPTDVLMDADGSLLVIDTGGWYKLCCPTSQLWKPDVLGAIYRVRRDRAPTPADPRGQRIDWPHQSAEQLWSFLSDVRPAVRQRATRELVHRGDSNEVQQSLAHWMPDGAMPNSVGSISCDAQTSSLARAWALVQMDSTESRRLLRQMLTVDDEQLRHVALHAASLNRDAEATPQLLNTLAHDTPANRRAAAEALGRIGNTSAVPHLLAAAATADDRILQHSTTYALIELADPTATRAGLASNSPRTIAAALIALDQMPAAGTTAEQVIPLLSARDDDLRGTAHWLVSQHTDWGSDLAAWLRQQLAAAPSPSPPVTEDSAASDLESMLIAFAGDDAVQHLLADTIIDPASSSAARQLALRAMARARLRQRPSSWPAALATVITTNDKNLLPFALAAARQLPPTESPDTALDQALLSIAEEPRQPQDLRIAALSVVASRLPELGEPLFDLLLTALAVDNPAPQRSDAADAIARTHLTPRQLESLCDVLKSAGPLELNRLLIPFKQSTDTQLGLKLISSLKNASALPSLRIDLLHAALANYDPVVAQGVDDLQSLVNVDAAEQRRRIEELLPQMAQGDVRRGHAVFHSAKAACSTCHRLGHAGGTTGPELTRIGESRTERDLLESILYPSLSFVRSYEPMLIITTDGRTISGIVRDETATEYVLLTAADQETRLRREDVEQIQPSTVSIMPGGLDKQLTTQELADLVAFLKHATGK